MRRRTVGACVTICMAIAGAYAWLPGSAMAIPTWLAPQGLSETGQSAEYADAAMAPSGAATVVWDRSDGTYLRVQASTRVPFGSFASPVDVSPEKQDGIFPQVADDGAGDATVVWMNVTGESTVEVATVTGGIPSAAVELSASGEDAEFPTVAVSQSGAAIVAWTRSNGTDYIAEAAFRPAGGSFGVPVQLSASGQSAEFPRVAIDAAGDATVVWERSNGTNTVIESATRMASTGSFTASVALSDSSESARNPTVAMDQAGDTAVTWTRSNGSDNIAQIVERPAGGSFGSTASLSAEGENAEYPQVALDGSGGATVVWTREATVEVASAALGGSFSTPQPLSYPALFPTIAEDAAGDVLVGFYDAEVDGAATAFRPAGGLFTSPQIISPPGKTVRIGGPGDEFQLNVAIDGQGDGLFGFVAENEAKYAIASETLLDAAGPLLNGLSIPVSATAGQPVTFAVSPVDQLSSVAGTTWSFGDASTASGALVTHTFADPGTYTVSVTSTDSLGNSSTQTGKIAVLAPPAPASFAGASITSRSVQANSHGQVRLDALCPRAFSCSGTVTLTMSVDAGKLATIAKAGSKEIVAIIAVGHERFSAGAGRSTSVTFTLPSVVRSLLTANHKLKASALVESQESLKRQATTRTEVTVKAPAKKHKKRHSKKH
jgi:hypothetical protein